MINHKNNISYLLIVGHVVFLHDFIYLYANQTMCCTNEQ